MRFVCCAWELIALMRDDEEDSVVVARFIINTIKWVVAGVAIELNGHSYTYTLEAD